MKLRWLFSQRTHVIHFIGPKTQVLGHFGPFRYYTIVDAKLAQIVQLTHKFTKWCCNGFFRIECNWLTPLDPKLIFWGILNRFFTARKSMHNSPNWCHYCTSSLKEVALKFFATNAPDPLHWTQNSCFGVFRTVSLLHERRCKTGRTGVINAQVRLTKSRLNFSQRTRPIHSIRPKTHVLGHFGTFRYGTKVDAKLAELAPLKLKFAKWSCVGFSRNERI
jgi:hypothetical protein